MIWIQITAHLNLWNCNSKLFLVIDISWTVTLWAQIAPTACAFWDKLTCLREVLFMARTQQQLLLSRVLALRYKSTVIVSLFCRLCATGLLLWVCQVEIQQQTQRNYTFVQYSKKAQNWKLHAEYRNQGFKHRRGCDMNTYLVTDIHMLTNIKSCTAT